MARRKLNYENPGTDVDLKCYMTNIEYKKKQELLVLLKHVAECLDIEGKGYVDRFELTVRKAIGYTHGCT